MAKQTFVNRREVEIDRPHPPAIFFIWFSAHLPDESIAQMIALGCDHGGIDLKENLVEYLRWRKAEFRDFGTHGRESVDYPDFGALVSRCVAEGGAERGILVCTSGIGMSIVANKFPGVRAALVSDVEDARSSREHNDANVLVLSGARTDFAAARQILEIWLETPFGGGRHQRRVDKIRQTELDLGTRLARPQEVGPRK